MSDPTGALRRLGRTDIAVSPVAVGCWAIVGDSTWGQLIIPARSKEQSESTNGLKIVAFASYINGYLLFETLQKFAEKNPNNLEIKALVTDDPVSPDAKISIKRRIWRLYGEKETISLEAAMVESALVKNIPVYTGAVKTDFFRKLGQTILWEKLLRIGN